MYNTLYNTYILYYIIHVLHTFNTLWKNFMGLRVLYFAYLSMFRFLSFSFIRSNVYFIGSLQNNIFETFS